MADSDSQGEDLPPYTPFTDTQDLPQDLEDLPEYTPFSDPSHTEHTHPTPKQPETFQIEGEENEEVVVEVTQMEYVQEMDVAAEVTEDNAVVEPQEQEVQLEETKSKGKKQRNRKKKPGKGQTEDLSEPQSESIQEETKEVPVTLGPG